MTIVGPYPRQRRHTLHFLEDVRAASPVHLDAEADVSALQADRAGRVDAPSVLVHVLQAVGTAVARHPEANAAIVGPGWAPRVVRYDHVDAKVTLDRWVDGTRAVISAVLPDVDVASRAHLQARLARLRDGDVDRLPETAGIRVLSRVPVPLGRWLFAAATRGPGRGRRLGTVSVTSLGHRRVQRFFSSGGTALTVGVGRVTDRPVARQGRVQVAPILPLSLTFDHRVLDGAAAADVLDDLVSGLEAVPAPEPGP